MSNRSHHLFDLGGTLVDSVATKREACALFLEERGAQIDRATLGRILDQRPLSRVRTRALIKEVCIPFMDGYLEQPDDEDVFKKIERSLPRTLIPGAIDYLEHLSKRDAKLAIVTNNRGDGIIAGVKGTDLQYFFKDEAVIGRRSADEPKKPHPYVYHKALVHLQADPIASIAYEDTPRGISAAMAAGIRGRVGMATSEQHDPSVLSSTGAHAVHADYYSLIPSNELQ